MAPGDRTSHGPNERQSLEEIAPTPVDLSSHTGPGCRVMQIRSTKSGFFRSDG